MSNYYGYTVTKSGEVYNRKGTKVSGYMRLGYRTVTIYKDFVSLSQIRVHRLVASIFIPNPYNLPVVHHIDLDKLNNDVTNLVWMSREDHAQLHWSLGDHSESVGGDNCGSNSTMTTQEVEDVCVLLSKGYKLVSIASMGYSYENVSTIKRRRTWKNISKDYTWGSPIHISNKRSSLTKEEVHMICNELQSGSTTASLVLKGYPLHPCKDIKRRRTWKHISDGYSF